MIKAFKTNENGIIEVDPSKFRSQYCTLIGKDGGIVPVEVLSFAVMTQDWQLACRIRTTTGFKYMEVTVDPQNLYETFDDALEELNKRTKKQLSTLK